MQVGRGGLISPLASCQGSEKIHLQIGCVSGWLRYGQRCAACELRATFPWALSTSRCRNEEWHFLVLAEPPVDLFLILSLTCEKNSQAQNEAAIYQLSLVVLMALLPGDNFSERELPYYPLSSSNVCACPDPVSLRFRHNYRRSSQCA